MSDKHSDLIVYTQTTTYNLISDFSVYLFESIRLCYPDGGFE